MTEKDSKAVNLGLENSLNVTKNNLSTSSESSIDELKNKKPVINYSNDVVDFNFLSDEILPDLEDEEIIEVASNTWKIENFRDLTETKIPGPVFEVGNYKWRLLLFPRGNANHNLALYLEPLPPSVSSDLNSEELIPIDPKWYICAQFTLIISNPKDSKNCVSSTSHQRFNKDATDWGFSNFVDIRYLWNSRKENGPLASDGRVNITAFVKVLKDPTGVLWHNFMDYDSKKVTGFVGFKNQGATCYLNSLLQSYFFTKIFRRAVYQIPTENEVGSSSVSLALQKIFYQLQKSDEALDTSELTRSFGWDTGDAFTQHDVQELNRVLMDKLETKMKGTSVENVLNKTFVGKMKSYIKCINVDYESSRTEDFWDIQLNVKNLSNLTESFQNYIEVEIMDGENQYAAQDYGLQDAKKGVVFEEFPTVLHLQLKRFEYDFNYDALVKINDRYEYPESIDLSPYLDHSNKSIAPDPCVYDLHGVLVHSGDITTGHYYTMIKPDKTDNWYRFDDDKVWKVTKRQVFEENFGMNLADNDQLSKLTRSQYQSYQIRRHTSAYMLVYIKRDQLHVALQEVTDSEIPSHISSQVDKELEERALIRKEREESHLYSNLNFYTSDLFKRYEGFDLGADQRDSRNQENFTEKDYPTTIRALKAAKFIDLYPELNSKFGIDCSKVKFWVLQHRRNNTIRPSKKIENFDSLTVDEIFQKYFIKKYQSGNIWIEIPELELSKLSGFEITDPSCKNQEHELVESPKLLIFIKYFDPETQSLKGLTHAFVSEEDNILSIIPNLNKILNFNENEKLDIYEEINSGSIEKLNINSSFYQSEISSGDILTVQRTNETQVDVSKQKKYPYYPTVDQYYLYLRTRVHVVAKKLTGGPSEDDGYVVIDENELDESNNKEVEFLISTQAKYEVLAKIVGSEFNVDPEYLRIFVNYGGQRTQLRTDMIISNIIPKVSYPLQPLFEFEVLSVPLKNLENMTLVKINWLPQGYMRYQVHDFFIERSGTIADIINKLQSKIDFSDEDKKNVLVWANSQSKFYQILFETTEVQALDQGIDIYAAILPEEVDILNKYYLNPVDDSDEDPNTEDLKPRLVPVLQFHKDPRRIHGISFVFPIYPGEKLKETKARFQNQLGLGQKDFSKVLICSLEENGQPNYFKDGNGENDDEVILANTLKEQEYLALDHPDRTARMGGHSVSGGGGISIK